MEHQNNNYLDDISTERLKWIGVDLDGTLSEFCWPDRGIGKIIPGAKESVYKLIEMGYKIVIYTSRYWSYYEAVERWCIDNDIRAKKIICGKPLFRWVIDDKNIEFSGDWNKAISIIKPYEEELQKI